LKFDVLETENWRRTNLKMKTAATRINILDAASQEAEVLE